MEVRKMLEDRNFTVELNSQDELIVSSKRRWVLILGCTCLAIVLSIPGVLISTGIYHQVVARRPLDSIIWPVLMAIVVSLPALGFWGILSHFCILRVARFNAREQQIAIKHLPWSGRELTFRDVRAIAICLQNEEKYGCCYLFLRRDGKKKQVRILSVSGDRNAEYFYEQLLPVGKLLAHMIGCPLEKTYDRANWLSVKSERTEQVQLGGKVD